LAPRPGSRGGVWPRVQVALVALLVGCGGESKPSSTPASKPTATPAAVRAGTCPVTLPNGNTPPGEKPSKLYHGNGELWTAMWPYNVIVAPRDFIRPDGTIEVKWPWFRGVSGPVQISGRKLDGKPARLRADVPDGYGPTGFQVSALLFPTEGCWRVTARVVDAQLTFVTLVVKQRA
jgi:hypothetical protein